VTGNVKDAPAEGTRQAARDAPAHILIVDDEAFIRGSFKLYFESMGFRVSIADGGDSALAVFRKQDDPIDVVLLDLVMPGTTGIDVLRRLKELDDDIEVIIATGCGSMHSAVEALRHGAYDYITKPIINFDDDLLRVVEEALAERRERLEKKRLLAVSAASPDARSPGEAAAFYRELESLARTALSPAASAETVHAVGSFLERFAGVAAAAVLEPDGGGSFVPLARWGAFAADGRAGALLVPGSRWLQGLEPRASWVRLPEGDASLDILGPAGGAEFLRAPIPGHPGRGGPARHVLLLRRAGDAAAPRAPDFGLLALVLSGSSEL
jgi:FixJ family two-component response regulator